MKKLITSLILFILIFEILFTNMSYADYAEESLGSDSTTTTSATTTGQNTAGESSTGNKTTDPLSSLDSSSNALAGFADGLVGILTWVFRLPFIAVASILEAVLQGIASLDGGGGEIKGLVTPDDIIFNRVGITNINFFDFSGSGTIITIRKGIATWYYALRILAIAILLAVLIYIGIRMALSSVASDKAKYSEMLKNWAVSFALVFILHFLIVAIIQFNNGLVILIGNGDNNQAYASTSSYDDIISALATEMVGASFLKSTAAILLFFIIIGMTFTFLVNYIKRFLTIGFLILISPLITITYSIDKMGDGKSQALNTWFKEFAFNILIQPFHGIIYMVFSYAAVELVVNGSALPGLIFSIICMIFMWDAEKIIKHIFGFNQSNTLGDTVASLALMKVASDVAKQSAGAAAKVSGKAANTTFGKNLGRVAKNSKIGQKVINSGAGKMVVNAKQGIKNAAQTYNKTIDDLRKSNKLGAVVVGELGEAAKKTAKIPVDATKGLIKNAPNIAVGAATWGLAAGANDKNALSYGITAFSTAKAIRDGNEEAIEKIQKKQTKAAEAIEDYAKKHGFKDFEFDDQQMNDLMQNIRKIWSTDMDALDRRVQMTLEGLYNKNNWGALSDEDQERQVDLAYERARNLDLKNPGGATKEEISFAEAVQRLDLAKDVKKLKDEYKDQKYDDPDMAVEEFFNDFEDRKIDYKD